MNANVGFSILRWDSFPVMCILVLGFIDLPAGANPAGGTVTQGTATITSQGSQLTINTSDRAAISWSSFNIGLGETTTFVQPSSSSVVWNQINDPNASQILGNLNANGYIVLQNSSGFYIGGQAAISAHGLVMTTSPMAVPDLSAPGAWQFTAPPPTASIINYGQIKTDGGEGGSLFLIAADVRNSVDPQNNYLGTLSAPNGNIGLYAGKEVLVSSRPDGRGLSAKVNLPQGSVDNEGKIIADAGTIAMAAQIVNQGGLLQADSVRQANGVIELVASDSLTLKAGSTISAQGDATATDPSPGGSIVVKSSNAFADNTGSAINLAGTQGGQSGLVEIFSPGVTAANLKSQISGQSAASFQAAGGLLLVNPQDVTLSSSASTPSDSSPNLNVSDLAALSKIDLFAGGNIDLASAWALSDSSDATAILSLTAGNNIVLENSASLAAGNNWSVRMSAGPVNQTSKPISTGGVYLNGSSYVSTENGDIDIWAAKEVVVDPGGPNSPVGFNGVRTLAGGSVTVTAEFGNVNAGGNPEGFLFGLTAPPYYRVSPVVGGISTAAGGDVTITAGGNVTSYLPLQNDYANAVKDGGIGAFGSQPGNVTITAGGNVSGNYVLANGAGTISAGGTIGAHTTSGGFALSLIKGSWNVSAANAVYVQDIRNPNGILNDTGDNTYAGYHLFDYDHHSSVSLSGSAVEFTGAGAPHSIQSAPGFRIPFILPPTLNVDAGAGGFTLDNSIVLFPSPYGELHIATHDGGNFQSYVDPLTPTIYTLQSILMSDSGATQWTPTPKANVGSFNAFDHASTPPELNNPNPVDISISGSIVDVTLRTTKATHVDVGQNTFNFGFVGENLHPSDVTYINVGGNISYPAIYQFVPISETITSPNLAFSTAWDSIFSLLVDPKASLEVPPQYLAAGGVNLSQATAYALSQGAGLRLSLIPNRPVLSGYDAGANPGFVYDPASGELGFKFQMTQNAFGPLNSGSLRILKLDPASGQVVVERHADGNYYFATTTASFVAPSELQTLHDESAYSVKNSKSLSPGFQIGGPGTLNVSASAIDLGSGGGIVSWGIGSPPGVANYSFLGPWTPSGAAVNVNVAGNLTLLTSTIASVYGGDVTVDSGAAISLSQGNFSLIPPDSTTIAYGIYTSGHSDVHVNAQGDIDVGGARIGTFNGGNVYVESLGGDINAGNGANAVLVVPIIYKNQSSGLLVSGQISNPRPFGSGIVAITPTSQFQTPGGNPLPGNIFVDSPQGDITSTLGGIQQFALDGTVAGGPTITLNAGTKPSAGSPGHPGNIDLGQGGVIGGTINITAQGDIKGLIVSRQNANINAAQSFSGTLLSSGTANVSAGGTVAGTIVGIGAANVSGGSGITADVQSQNATVGGTTSSTLGTSAAATSGSQAASQQAASDSQQQLANKGEDTDDNKKKQTHGPALTKHVSRVRVILPGNS